MIRSLAKSGIACALHLTGAGRLRGRGGPGAVVVAYHRVVEEYPGENAGALAPMLIGRLTLERQLEWLARRFTIVPPEELGRRLEAGALHDRPLAAVTFDDGYGDLYENAFPLLMKIGIPAAVFVVTGLVGTTALAPHDRADLLLRRAVAAWGEAALDLEHLYRRIGLELPRLDVFTPTLERGGSPARSYHDAIRRLLETLPQAKLTWLLDRLEDRLGIDAADRRERRPLTWDELRIMRRAGLAIGSHTRTHPLLTRESPERTMEELRASHRDLEEHLGVETRLFAYPNGWFDGRTVAAVAAARYRYAFTSCRHVDAERPWLTIPRVLLWERSAAGPFGRFSPSLMDCQAHGTFDALAGCRLEHAGAGASR